MSSAFVYLPDDEPDAQMFNGHAFVLRANGTTEFRVFDPSLSEAEVADLEWLGDPKDRKPSGVVMVRWPDVAPSAVAEHVASKLAKWGARQVSAPVVGAVATVAADQPAVDEAERQYLIGTKEWAESVILAESQRNEPRAKAGLSVAESSECARARAWLKSKEGALKTAGLL